MHGTPKVPIAYSVLGNQFVTRGSVATNPPAIYNSQPLIYVGRDDLRYNAGFFAHIDVNDHVKPMQSSAS